MSKHTDYLIRGLVAEKNIRFTCADTTGTVTDGIFVHNLDPVSAHIFGRALTTTVLVAPLLEGEEKYSFRWMYEGELTNIVTDVNTNCDVRGIIKEHNLMNSINSENELYGEKGQVSVIKSCNGKILNSGLANAGLMDVVDDIGFFFSTSDQIETEMNAMISLNSDPENPVAEATGFMIQAMPGCDLPEFEKLRMKTKTSEFGNMMLDKRLQEEKKLWKLLELLFDMPYQAIKEQYGVTYEFSNNPTYTCNCSIEKMKLAVKTLGEQDIKKLLNEQGVINITCEFCNTQYSFNKNDL